MMTGKSHSRAAIARYPVHLGRAAFPVAPNSLYNNNNNIYIILYIGTYYTRQNSARENRYKNGVVV